MNNGMVIYSGYTPTTVSLERGSGYFKKAVYEISMDKAGYDRQTILLQGRVTGWYLGGNLLFGGLIGWFIVDPASGAMWRLEPSYVSATLLPNKTTPIPEGSGN